MKESVDKELSSVSCKVKFYYSHGLPIPECFNIPTEQALKDDPDYIWYVEEDVVIPESGLQAMIDTASIQKNGLIAINYPLRHYGGLSEGWYREGTSEPIRTWVGLGCTLARRDVFNKIREFHNGPFFQPVKLISVHGGSATIKKSLTVQACDRRYGGQDIYICHLVRKAGFNISAVPDMRADHLNLPIIA